jgi:UDP-2-acetamido-3-amino-2,3-dideoxy-glucuronate N-acetyltransferase
VARRQASLDEFERDVPGVAGYLDLDEAIASSGATAWVVATSNAAHVPATRKLLEAGMAVLLEKPLADTVAEAESLAPLVAPGSASHRR